MMVRVQFCWLLPKLLLLLLPSGAAAAVWWWWWWWCGGGGEIAHLALHAGLVVCLVK